ncbi:MAG: DedA family protein [Rikenellaceae bacterium]|jgi:membrane protein YqaA with SNARE-associated domain|nr:DedA family protein [Rikenellaceae bacterium]
MKKIYHWILHWADTRWGVLALFLMAFAESSFFPVPPDVLLIACCLGCTVKSFRYATVCTAGSVLGAMGGYALGYFLWLTAGGEFTGVANFFFDIIPGFTPDRYLEIRQLYNDHNFWVIFTAGFTPIPYKLFTIAGGVFKINFAMFVVASVISRGLRFLLIAWLIWRFGSPIKAFIEKYFNWLAIAFTVLLIGSFSIVKYIG